MAADTCMYHRASQAGISGMSLYAEMNYHTNPCKRASGRGFTGPPKVAECCSPGQEIQLSSDRIAGRSCIKGPGVLTRTSRNCIETSCEKGRQWLRLLQLAERPQKSSLKWRTHAKDCQLEQPPIGRFRAKSSHQMSGACRQSSRTVGTSKCSSNESVSTSGEVPPLEGKYQEVAVAIEKVGRNTRRIEASIDVCAPTYVVWGVLTDYGSLADVVPGLVVNEVLETRPQGAKLLQVRSFAHYFWSSFRSGVLGRG
jgi:hypothetical protein